MASFKQGRGFQSVFYDLDEMGCSPSTNLLLLEQAVVGLRRPGRLQEVKYRRSCAENIDRKAADNRGFSGTDLDVRIVFELLDVHSNAF